MKQTIQQKTDRIDAGNREAAEVILADPVRFAGAQLIWARLWMGRHPLTGKEMIDGGN